MLFRVLILLIIIFIKWKICINKNINTINSNYNDISYKIGDKYEFILDKDVSDLE